MDNFLHGKCTSGGLCDNGCQEFIAQENSRRCVDFGHNDSKHIIVAVKVVMEGYQLLPRVPTETVTPADELRERVNSFRRETHDPKPKEKLPVMCEKLNKVLNAILYHTYCTSSYGNVDRKFRTGWKQPNFSPGIFRRSRQLFPISGGAAAFSGQIEGACECNLTF